VQTLLQCTALTVRDLSVLPRRSVVLLHRLLAFSATWVEYMDEFMAWKVGDGARWAQALAAPFRDAHRRHRQYADAMGDEADADHHEATRQLLEGAESTLRLIDEQLATMLGPQGALRWKEDQLAALRREDDEPPAPAPIAPVAAAAPTPAPAPTPGPAPPSATASTRAPGLRRGFLASEPSSAAPRAAALPPSPMLPPTGPPPPRTSAPAAPLGGADALVRRLQGNEALAHELMVDPSFRVVEPDWPSGLAMDDALDEDEAGASAEASGAGARDATAAQLERLFLASVGRSADGALRTRAWREWRGAPAAQQGRFPSYWREVLGIAAAERGDAGADLLVGVVMKVQELLASFVPPRAALRRELEAAVDPSWLRDALRTRTLPLAWWSELTRRWVAVVQRLEAPVREEATAAWAAATDARWERWVARAADGPADGALVPRAVLDVLPRFLAWLHHVADLIRVDAANFHLSSLAPVLLTGGAGADYERRKFFAAVARGETALRGTEAWMRRAAELAVATADAAAGERAAGAGAPDERVAAARRTLLARALVATADAKMTRLAVLSEGVVDLLRSSVPLVDAAVAAAASADGVARWRVRHVDDGEEEAAAARMEELAFPETLALDAQRLTKVQDVVQRAALVAALSALLLQFLTGLPGGARLARADAPAGDDDVTAVRSLSDLQRHLDAWLRDDGVRVADVVAGCVFAVRQLAAREVESDAHGSAGADLTPAALLRAAPLPAAQEAALEALVRAALSASHPVVAVMRTRVLRWLRARTAQAVVAGLPPGSDVRSAGSNVVWMAVAAEPAPAAAAAVAPVLAAELHALAQNLALLVRHSEAVHSQTYRAFLAGRSAVDVARDVATAAPASASVDDGGGAATGVRRA
jgi:hypothetical protein